MYPFTAEQRAEWEMSEEEKNVLEMGLVAWQKDKASKKKETETKRVKAHRKKMRGEATLVRDILVFPALFATHRPFSIVVSSV